MLAEILKYKNAFYFLAGFASAFSLFTIYSFHHQAIGHTSNSPSFPKRKKILFFGDSITQHGYNVEIDGWVAQLAHWWSRRADIINRGYSGYNSRWGRMIIEPIVTEEKPDMIFVFFGANDAVDESVHQFVPLLEYTDNIRSIIRTVRLHGVSTKIILISPPPIWEEKLQEFNRNKGKPLLIDRLNERTLQYVNACKELSLEMNVPLVDLWTKLEGATDKRALYLYDGLHLSKEGCDKLAEAVKETVEEYFPLFRPDLLPMHLAEPVSIKNPRKPKLY